MPHWIVLLVVGMIVAIIFLSRESPQEGAVRKKFLEAMADFLEGRLEKLERYDNSYKINFEYEGKVFCFEDIEEQAFQRRTHKGFLKAKTPTKLTLSFTEKSRTAIRSNISSLSEFTTMWTQDRENVGLSKEIGRAHV